MFDFTSRYAALETATITGPDGQTLTYVRRRFLPRGKELPLLQEVTVGQGDRLDLITARTLGDPTGYWRICDANDAQNPSELTEEVGQVLRVPVPQTT